jgi:hypothetical protein
MKNKRDIFKFDGITPTAINLEHVTNICIEGKKITFSFYTNALYIELETEQAAKDVFEQLINVWGGKINVWGENALE